LARLRSISVGGRRRRSTTIVRTGAIGRVQTRLTSAGITPEGSPSRLIIASPHDRELLLAEPVLMAQRAE
jgi:hypothetical protein